MNLSLISAFFRGVGSVLDIWPATRPLPERSDEEALAGDWKKVGEDIQPAIDKVGKDRAIPDKGSNR